MIKLFSTHFGWGGPCSRVIRVAEGDDDGGGGGGGGDDGGGGGGGGDNPTPWDSFISSVDEQFREAPSILKFKEHENPVSALATSYVNAEQLIGRDKIPMPKTDAEFIATYRRLGAPESPEEYELTPEVKADSPEETAELERQAEWIRKTAHKLGLSKKQAAEMYKESAADVHRFFTEYRGAADAELSKGLAILRDEFGANFDRNMTIANRAIEFVGGKDVIDVFKRTGVGRHPEVVKMMLKVGQAFSEDIGIDKNTGDTLDMSKTLDGQIKELMASDAYKQKGHPLHKQVTAQVANLFERKEGHKPRGSVNPNHY